jgi:hypothetical protein
MWARSWQFCFSYPESPKVRKSQEILASFVTLSCRLYSLIPPIALHHEPSKSVEIIHGHTMGNEVDLTRWALSRRAAAVAWSRDEEPDAWEIEVDTPLHA